MGAEDSLRSLLKFPPVIFRLFRLPHKTRTHPMHGPQEGGSHNFEALKKYILERSQAQEWTEATKEWDCLLIYQSPGGKCVCEHHPITDHCVIRNRITAKQATVGNVCVDRFGTMAYADLAFQALKRIIADPSKHANESLIQLARTSGVINDWEENFYRDVWRDKKLNVKQNAKILQINKKIIANMKPP